jgi:N-acetylmuramoyl-L-alanine amidase
MRKIDYIVIHCTATPRNTKVSSILNYWKNNLKWKNVGYHFLIEENGNINRLVSLDKVTNGVKGFNSVSIHISYIGGQFEDDRTEAQKGSILLCIKESLDYIKKKVVIQGHRDFPNVAKSCPQFDAKKEYEWINI